MPITTDFRSPHSGTARHLGRRSQPPRIRGSSGAPTREAAVTDAEAHDGEREVRDILIAHGFDARRDGRLDDALDHNVAGYHFEVKRTETLAPPEWTRQADADADADGRIAVVAYRRSREPWRASLPLDALARLMSFECALRDVERLCVGDAARIARRALDPMTTVSVGGLGPNVNVNRIGVES
jgi:hypothetical protein